MGMEWVKPKAGIGACEAELVITIVGKGKQLSFSFKDTTLRLKFGGLDRVVIGFDEEKNEIGFKPVTKGGYKISKSPISNSARSIAHMAISNLPRGIKASDVANTYDTLKYDAQGEYYYVHVCDSEFKAAKIKTSN